MGVLSVFAVLWSALETWSWSRRSGKLAVDPMTLGKLIANTCGSLANVFLAVIYFASLYWFIFFKQQTVLHVVLPSYDQELEIKHYVISIFALKVRRLTFLRKIIKHFCFQLVDMAHLILTQISVDIFLLDWERPHPVSSGTKSGEATKEMAVSVWRTYLVANEWNELQTRRKTHLALQIILVLFILKV